MHSVRRPWWQQATALVTVTTGGVITGFNFVPGAATTMTSPTSVPLHLLALEQAAQPGAAMNARAVGGDSADTGTSDGLLRSAIVNVAKYYLQIASTRSPAQMEALIWDSTSVNGADHGPSCAAFASLTLELAAQAVGQQSWVSGGASYPWPLPAWADVRVDTNPASPAITSVVADAQKHDRWHQVGDGYQPQPGDWVLFAHHVEVVTRYSDGVLDTIGADSDPGLTVNAHSYGGTLAADGVAGFVDNGHLDAASFNAATAAPEAAVPKAAAPAAPKAAAPKATAPKATAPGAAAPKAASPGAAAAVSPGGLAVVPGITEQAPQAPTHSVAPSGAGSAAKTPEQKAPAAASHGTAATASAASGTAAIPGAAQPVTASAPVAASHSASSGTADVPGVAKPAGIKITASPADRAAARSAGQALDARGNAALIPGSSPAAGASAGGAAAVPGASPATVAPTAKPSTTPAVHPASTVPTPHASSSAASAGQYKQYAPAAQATPGTRVQQAFISLIAPGAVAAQQRWGVPAAVTIAQAIEESAWGNSKLAADYHNLFGIKGSGPAGSVGLPTSEFYNGQWVTIDAQFRAYHNAAESIADHAELLATSGYYQRAMADRSIPDAFANDLTGVYATDPDYGANLIALMKLYNLYRFDGPAQSVAPVHPQSAQPSATSTPTPAASATPTPAASAASTGAQPTTGPSAAAQPAPTPAAATSPAATSPAATQPAAQIPGVVAPSALVGTTAVNYQRQPAGAAATAARYQPQFTTAVTTAYFATAKGPLGHGEHLYRDVAGQTGIRWELLAACDWMQCKAHPRFSPVHGEKIGSVNSDGTSYATKSAALGQCASDLIELAGAVYGIDLTARRFLSVRALADAFAAFRWGALLLRHGVSAMEFPYSVAGLTAQHQKMHWPGIDDPAAPDRPGARFREPFGAVPVVLSLDYPATVLTDRKRRQPVFRFLSWLRRRSNAGAQVTPPSQQVTVQLADGQLAHGRVVEQRLDGEGADGPYHPTIVMVGQPAGPGPQYPRRRWHRFIPRWAKWTIVIVIVLLFFRRIAAWAVLAALSAALHLFGVNVDLPHVSFGWPWSSATTTNTLVGPIVLQKIEGIDKPALGTENFNFVFTRKVTKNIGFLPCWYSASFYAVGRASATVDLNPGTAWWKPSTGHYRLRVLTQPAGSIPGKLAITMALPLPQLPQSVHDVSIDNTLSSPISTNHSWTYPGLACGALIQPQFAQSALYAQAQSEAYHQATTLPSVTKPLIAAAEKEAATIIRDNFIAPTAGALNYSITTFSIRWVPPAG